MTYSGITKWQLEVVDEFQKAPNSQRLNSLERHPTMFRKAQIKIAMMKEKNGLKKLNPFFWKAAKPIYIPEDNAGADHGRPVIVLNGDEPDQKMVLVLFRDRLVAQYPDRSEQTLKFT